MSRAYLIDQLPMSQAADVFARIDVMVRAISPLAVVGVVAVVMWSC